MKNKNFKLLGLGVLMAFTACETEPVDEQLNSINGQVDLNELTELTTNGQWRVTSFIDSGEDKTTDFNGYGFDFQAGGALIADNSSNTIEGSWSITMDDNDRDGSDDDNHGILGEDCKNCTIAILTEVLTACEGWYIDKLEDGSDNDLEDNFAGFTFIFDAQGGVTMSSNSGDVNGSWSAEGEGQNIKVTVQINGYDDLSMEWNLHEIELYQGESKVDLRLGDDLRLRFKNNCTINLSAMDDSTSNSSANTLDDVDFNIFFAAPEDFNELTEDWKIISYSATKIELKHVSGGNGGTDLLTFEK